jgi:hypothetical protein
LQNDGQSRVNSLEDNDVKFPPSFSAHLSNSGEAAQRDKTWRIAANIAKLPEAFAEVLARTSEGRRRAQARGVRFGRKLKLTVHQ